jgi:hypothetical protein
MTTLAVASALPASSASSSAASSSSGGSSATIAAAAAASTAGAAAPVRSTLRAQAAVAGVVLAAFTAFSLWVIYGYGYTGFLSLAGREPWALQLLIDLAISLTFAVGWVRADARRLGISAWPFLAATPFVGSIAVLAYMVRRAGVTPRRGI